MAEHSLGHDAQSRYLLDTYIPPRRQAGLPRHRRCVCVAGVKLRQALEWLERTADYQGGNLACLRLDPFFTPPAATIRNCAHCCKSTVCSSSLARHRPERLTARRARHATGSSPARTQGRRPSR